MTLNLLFELFTLFKIYWFIMLYLKYLDEL